jgi:hypothetical protein
MMGDTAATAAAAAAQNNNNNNNNNNASRHQKKTNRITGTRAVPIFHAAHVVVASGKGTTTIFFRPQQCGRQDGEYRHVFLCLASTDVTMRCCSSQHQTRRLRRTRLSRPRQNEAATIDPFRPLLVGVSTLAGQQQQQ